MSPPSSGNRRLNRTPCKAKLWRSRNKGGRRDGLGGPVIAGWPLKRGSVAAVGRLRKRRRTNKRLQRSGGLRIKLLGFERQSRPGPGHVGEDRPHPQGRRALSHLPAFDGALSALDRSNHRHPAERSRTLITTIRQLQPVFSGWPPARRNYLQILSRIPDR
jgi:hypothetical protein